MSLINDTIEWYQDWRYSRLYKKFRRVTKEIELRQFARDTTKINDLNKAESFVAFLDRIIDVLARRRAKISSKMERIYSTWKV
jgi:hypothetical protein